MNTDCKGLKVHTFDPFFFQKQQYIKALRLSFGTQSSGHIIIKKRTSDLVASRNIVVFSSLYSFSALYKALFVEHDFTDMHGIFRTLKALKRKKIVDTIFFIMSLSVWQVNDIPSKTHSHEKWSNLRFFFICTNTFKYIISYVCVQFCSQIGLTTFNIYNWLIAVHLSMLHQTVYFQTHYVFESGRLLNFMTWKNNFIKKMEHNLKKNHQIVKSY